LDAADILSYRRLSEKGKRTGRTEQDGKKSDEKKGIYGSG
jgi:hypothetical protein